MPRRNLWLIFGAVAVALACYRVTDRNPYGRYFSEIVSKIEQRYIDSVDQNQLWQGAVKGLIGQLSDPYSAYLPPTDAVRLGEQIDQKFAGIGIRVEPSPEGDRLVVISPIVGSPAYRAGVLAGDTIDKIDGQSTRGMTVGDAANRIRGLPGEAVRLTVIRKGEKNPIDLPPIKREIINIESVLGDTRDSDDQWDFLIHRDPNIGYIRIVNFGDQTANELADALRQLKTEGMQGLILDLRNNPGGLLNSAIDVCNFFLPAGKQIVTTRRRDESIEQEFTTRGGEKFLDIPMVVLINGNSASASEIVAACLQDHDRAKIIGERSWGKGTVQDVIDLHGGRGKLTLTTSSFWRPSGHNIHRRKGATETDEWGVSPQEGDEVKLTDEESLAWNKWRSDRDIVRPRNGVQQIGKENGGTLGDPLPNDPALKRAVEYLTDRL